MEVERYCVFRRTSIGYWLIDMYCGSKRVKELQVTDYPLNAESLIKCYVSAHKRGVFDE